MVAHTCNASICEVGAGGAKVQGLYIKFRASLGCLGLVPKLQIRDQRDDLAGRLSRKPNGCKPEDLILLPDTQTTGEGANQPSIPICTHKINK